MCTNVSLKALGYKDVLCMRTSSCPILYSPIQSEHWWYWILTKALLWYMGVTQIFECSLMLECSVILACHVTISVVWRPITYLISTWVQDMCVACRDMVVRIWYLQSVIISLGTPHCLFSSLLSFSPSFPSLSSPSFKEPSSSPSPFPPTCVDPPLPHPRFHPIPEWNETDG